MIKACLKLLWIVVMGMGFFQSSLPCRWNPVAENGEVNAAIAVQDLTRIAVEGDRIVHVRGLEGAYELKHDPLSRCLVYSGQPLIIKQNLLHSLLQPSKTTIMYSISHLKNNGVTRFY